VKLSPSDRYLAHLLGITPEEMEAFNRYVLEEAAKQPQPAVVAGIETLVLLVVSVAIQIGASLLAPKPQPPSSKKPGQLKGRQEAGPSKVSAPAETLTSAISSAQNVAELNTPVPLIYAKEEILDGEKYGGIRVALPLLWSQIQSHKSHHVFRGVFMLGQGTIAEIDPTGFAFGENSIGAYDLDTANDGGSRIAFYLSRGGGRLRPSDHFLGRSAREDPGNAVIDGGPDVYAIRGVDNAWSQDFCYAFSPSSNATFGLSGLIGNDFGLRLNPTVRPTRAITTKANGDETEIQTYDDSSALVAVWKQRYVWPGRWGIVSTSKGNQGRIALVVGDTFTYKMHPSSNAESKVIFEAATNLGGGGEDYEELCGDVGGTVASRQKAADGALVVGDLYRAGSCWAILIRRPDEAFVSNADFEPPDHGGREMAYEFRVVRDGEVECADEGEDVEASTADIRPEEQGPDAWSDDKLFGIYGILDRITPPTLPTTTGTPPTVPGKYGYPTLSTPWVYRGIPGETISGNGTGATFDVTTQGGEVTAIRQSGDRGRDYAVGDRIRIRGELLEVTASGNPPATGGLPVGAIVGLPDPQGTTPEATIPGKGPDLIVTVAALDFVPPLGQGNLHHCATNGAQIYKLALADVTIPRPGRVVELGLSSTVGTQVSGLCNLRDAPTLYKANNMAANRRDGTELKEGEILTFTTYQSGQLSRPMPRWSFFRLWVRYGPDRPYVPGRTLLGVMGNGRERQLNSFRVQAPPGRKIDRVRLEPISGWEVRNGINVGDLFVLDAGRRAIETIDMGGSMVVFAAGYSVDRRAESFGFQSLEPKRDLGFGFIDPGSMWDRWAGLAEAFVYEEIGTSAGDGPEHQVAYVNSQTPNAVLAEYGDIALLGMNVRSAPDLTQLSQVSARYLGGREVDLFLGEGRGPSHLFPELLRDALLLTGRIRRPQIADDFREAAIWNFEQRLFCDINIASLTNVREWAQQIAPTMLLAVSEYGGQWHCKPALSFDPVPITALFTAGNIAEKTFKLQWFDAEERRPIQVSVRWREERPSSSPTSAGIFPVERQALVRESVVPVTAPIEELDVSEWVSSRRHAIMAAKFLCRTRRFGSHTISFETVYGFENATVTPDCYIKVAMEQTYVDAFNNGVCLEDGIVTSTLPIVGSVPVLAWDGTAAEPYRTKLTVKDGRGSLPGHVFTVLEPTVRTYRVTKVSPTKDGRFEISAVHAPVNRKGVLEIAANWDEGWEIT
jgi:hypothetical protein